MVLAGPDVRLAPGGILMSLFLNNAGGAWDNAKKYVETGKYGGKGSEAHKAAVQRHGGLERQGRRPLAPRAHQAALDNLARPPHLHRATLSAAAVACLRDA